MTAYQAQQLQLLKPRQLNVIPQKNMANANKMIKNIQTKARLLKNRSDMINVKIKN